MLIVTGSAKVDPAAVPQLKVAAAEMMAATRAEPGCEFYSLAIEDEAAGLMTIAERWSDEASLRAHAKTPHMAAFNKAIGPSVRGMDLKIYEGDREVSLR
jgi:quinol monooxygenase YgiN